MRRSVLTALLPFSLPLPLLCASVVAAGCEAAAGDAASQDAVAGDAANADGTESDVRVGDGTAGDTKEPEPSGVSPRVTWKESDFFSGPWPTDARRDSDGHLNLAGFPNPEALPILEQFIAAAEDALDGYSIVTPVYFTFNGALDPARLPSAAGTLSPGAAVFLVDVEPSSPDYGQRVPLDVTWSADPGFTYLPANLLMLQPLYGTPLREGTHYAAVVLRSLRDADGLQLAQPVAVRDALADGGDPIMAPLRDYLASEGLSADEVAVATVFTTGTPTREMAQIAEWAASRAPQPALEDLTKTSADGGAFKIYEGHYTSPNLQHGVRPYDTEGGSFIFEGSDPTVAEIESLRVAMSVPNGAMPAAGWPVVLYGHGTGGDYKSFLTSGTYSVGRDLAARGFVVMGIDQPLHGPRAPPGTNPDTASFNVFNPDAFRCNFRQGATDVLFQARFAKTVTFDGMHLDPKRIFYLGHSQGGLSGALMAPFAPDIGAFVFSGTGGGLAYTLMLRKEPVDMKGFLEFAMAISRPEELRIGHPVLSLLQALADNSDPLAYARGFQEPQGRAPLNMLLTSGTEDAQTPALASINLAAASLTPLMAPAPLASPAHDLLGLAPAQRPLQGNVSNANGTATRLMAQFSDADHFVIFDDKRAGKPVLDFLTSALTNNPPIIAK